MNLIEYLGDGRFLFGFEGKGIKISSLAILDKDSGLPAWWLVDDRVTDESWDVAEVQLTGVSPGDMLDGVIPKDSDSGRDLSEVELGKVPAGFRQVLPDSERQLEVESGKKYMMVIIGSQWMSMEFIG